MSGRESEKNPSKVWPDDAVLAASVASGDQDALTVLFDRYSKLVFSVALQILRDEGEAEETVQQVFLDIFRSIKQFDPVRGDFKTWLLQFAYHRSINRKEHLQSMLFYDWRQLDDIVPEELVDGAGCSFQMSGPELVHLAEELLASLDQRHRRILEMTLFGGYTAKEIAESSGETASAVRHSLYRSLGRLHAALTKNEREQRTPEAAKEGAYIASPRTL